MSLHSIVYSLFSQTMMEMCQISFHWIFSRTNATNNNIKRINKVNTKDYWGCRYFTSCNDRKCRNHKTKKHTPRITNNTSTTNIKAPKNKNSRNKDNKPRENETRIVLRSKSCIGKVEFQRESRKYNRGNKSYARCHSSTIITPVNSIHHKDIPYNGCY